MTGYNRKQIAEMIQRYVVGGNVSVDSEFYMDEVYPIIDSLVVAYLSQLIESKGNNWRDAVNEMWLKNTGCQDIVSECICGQQVWYYDMPVNYLPLPNDSGIFIVKFKSTQCQWDVATKTTIKNANTYLPSIAGLMPQSFYLEGNRTFLTQVAEKIDNYYLPVTADLGDDDFVALPPLTEDKFQIMLHDYFAGRGNAPKDRMANQMDVKQ